MAPDIRRERFGAILQQAGSPAAPEAGRMYEALAAGGVSPACFLAFFQHESRFGLLGICKEFDTRNPGNVRSPERPDTGAVIVQTPRGPFAKYPNWTVATRDWAARLRGPKYAGSGLLTVKQVLPKYAPPADSNNPDAYARAVLASIERWTTEGGPMIQLTGKIHLLPPEAPNNPNRPMWGGRPKWITIHETDNYNAGANAAMHDRYVHGSEHGGGASYHAVVDDQESIQLLPWTSAGYHIGDGDGGEGNNTSIGMELCVNKGSDFTKTVDRAARLTAALLHEFGLPLERVRQHGSWWSPRHPNVHKNCPDNLKTGRLGPTWDGFIALVARKYAAAYGPKPDPVVDLSAKLKGAYAALPRWIVGLAEYEATADLREVGLAADIRCLVCEKSVLWTNGATIDAFHRGQYEDFKARGKVVEARSKDLLDLLQPGVDARTARRLAREAAKASAPNGPADGHRPRRRRKPARGDEAGSRQGRPERQEVAAAG